MKNNKIAIWFIIIGITLSIGFGIVLQETLGDIYLILTVFLSLGVMLGFILLAAGIMTLLQES